MLRVFFLLLLFFSMQQLCFADNLLSSKDTFNKSVQYKRCLSYRDYMNQDIDPTSFKKIDINKKFLNHTVKFWSRMVQHHHHTNNILVQYKISKDNKNLALLYIKCDLSNNLNEFTGAGVLVMLHSSSGAISVISKPFIFPNIAYGNATGIYKIYDWIPKPHDLLMYTQLVDLGAGASGDPTKWQIVSFRKNIRPVIFSTGNDVKISKNNSIMFFSNSNYIFQPTTIKIYGVNLQTKKIYNLTNIYQKMMPASDTVSAMGELTSFVRNKDNSCTLSYNYYNKKAKKISRTLRVTKPICH